MPASKINHAEYAIIIMSHLILRDHAKCLIWGGGGGVSCVDCFVHTSSSRAARLIPIVTVSAYVITVGSFRPVISSSFETWSAILAIGSTTSKACCVRSPVGASYFSRYMRMVAPATPVPESLKTKREPS